MERAETFETVNVGGVGFHFPPGKEQVAARSIVNMVRANIPDRMWGSVKNVMLSSQRNREDDYWSQKLGKPSVSAASMDPSGTMTVYRGDSLAGHTAAHEAGHSFATSLWGDFDPPIDSEYGQAQKAEKPVSEYGATSPAEDFAEAVQMYVLWPESLRTSFPKKYAAVDRLVRG